MTTFNRRPGEIRDFQDATERGMWGERTDVPGAGSIMRVRGTGTTEVELPVINFGYSFNLPVDSDAEVVMLALGGDPNNKVALPTSPRDQQYQWPVGTGGVQHPSDPNRRIEFNGDETFLRDGTFVVGSNREVTITVDGANVIISTGGIANIQAQSIVLNAPGGVEINSATLIHNGINVGETHRHDGVDPGPGLTGLPQ